MDEPMHGDFDARAATWDDDPAKVERARVVADAIRARVPLSPSTRMLEYGAGTGLVTQALRESVGPVTLADTSSGMREQMQRKVEAGLLPDARVVDLDLSEGAPAGERFDLIVTVMVLHHIDPLEPVLEAFAELLEPGGHLCAVDLEQEDGSFHGEGFGGHHGFVPDELAGQVERAGFAEVSVAPCATVDKGGVTYPLFLATARA
jgi:predicted TPR repeat methyltransferase